jgi:hypothetical protein
VKTIIITFLLFLVFSTLLIGVVGIGTGFPSSGLPVEVLQDPRTSFSDEALRTILESDKLRLASNPQLLILGSSAAQEAYRPGELQPDLPFYQVNNLAIGGANIGEIRETFLHCIKAMPTGICGDSAILIALSYPLFAPDETRWKHPEFVSPAIVASGLFISDLKREAMRNPLVLDSGNPVFKVLPGTLVSLGKWRCAFWADFRRIHPEHPGDALSKWKGWKWRLRKRHAGDQSLFLKRRKPEKRELPSPREQMEWLSDYMGSEPGVLVPEQFDCLSGLICAIRSDGLKVFIVDMPLPSWHRTESPYVGPYRERLRETLAPFRADKGVVFIDLSESADDNGFRDSIHPAVANRRVWSSTLAEELIRSPTK